MDSVVLISIIGSAVVGAGIGAFLVRQKRPGCQVAVTAEGAPTAGGQALAPASCSSLVVQDRTGSNALAVTQLPMELFDQIDAPAQNKLSKKLSRLNALFQGVPTFANAAQGTPANVWEVAINGPLLRALDENKEPIKGAFRAMTHGTKGHHFKEHALLTKPESINALMSATAFWQIASIVVAQKHLADISQRLEGIETGLERVESKMDAKRRSELKGVIEYLKEISDSILAGHYSPHFRVKLEDHAEQMLKAKHEIADILRARINALLNIKDPDAINADGYADLIRTEMVVIATLFREWLLCSRARFQAWSLLAVMPGDEVLKPKRYNGIVNDLVTMMDPIGPMGAFSKNIHVMTSRIHARVWTAEALSKLRMNVSNEFEDLKKDLWADFETERKLVDQGADLLKDIEQPTRILVQTKGDEVVSLKHLPANELPQIAHQNLLPSVFSQQTIQSVTQARQPRQ